MKKGIHPQWYPQAKVTCACGYSFSVGATKPEIRVEICRNCHPFFTGEMKYVDTQGRVEKFQQKQKIAQAKASLLNQKKKKKEEKKEEKRPRTLREMLLGIST